MSEREEVEPRETYRKNCHKCGHADIMRIPRLWHDRLLERLTGRPLRRYRCGRCRAEFARQG